MSVDYHAILPELILAGTIMLVLIVDLFLPARLKWGSMPIGLLGVLGSLVAVLTLLGDERATFGGSFVVDNFAVLFKVFFLVAAVIVLAVSRRYFDQPRLLPGRVLLPAAHVVPRLPADALVARPADAVHLAGARVGARVPDGGVPQVGRDRRRGRPEVLPDRRAVHRRDALRDEPDLRADRGRDEARRDRHRAGPARSVPGVDGARVDPVRRRGLRVQGLRVPLPVLGARTPTRARRSRWRRSWRWRPRRPGSRGCCS